MRRIWGFILVLVLVSVMGRVGAQDATATPIPYTELFAQTEQSLTFKKVSLETNTCLQDLFEANRSFFPAKPEYGETWELSTISYLAFSTEMVVPPHEDCYHILTVRWRDLPRIEAEYNVCIEDMYGLGGHFTAESGLDESGTVYLPKGALPCLNAQGQRLLGSAFGTTPREYSPVPFVEGPEDLSSLGYCPIDLSKANPTINSDTTSFLSTIPYIPGRRIFVPPDLRRCQSFYREQETLYELSQQFNICIEMLLETNQRTGHSITHLAPRLYIPLDAPPCYDADGQRLGRNDRAVYMPEQRDSLLDIARKYDVCLDDLWDANHLVGDMYRGYVYVSVKQIGAAFIPNTPPCEGPTTFTVKSLTGILELSFLTNICYNRLQDANPSILYIPGTNGKTFATGQVLNIPDRPHCYDLTTGHMQQHVCYPVAVTEESNFTGHEPPINASTDTDLPYCYERVPDMTVFYDNQPYTLYQIRGYESDLFLSQCFDIDVEKARLKAPDGSGTYGLNGYIMSSFYISQPHADCGFLGLSDEQHYQHYIAMTYKAGSIQDGVYIVNRGDSLTSIGRQYGYLPEWIAEANALSSTDWVYYLQELKMPPYPSLYTLLPVGGAAGVIVLASSAIYGLRRWRISRAGSKKKNS